MKLTKFFTTYFILLILLSSCSGITEGLTGTKRSKTSDEFLVHKKKPLVVPPNFDEMPVPNAQKNKRETQIDNTSIQDLLNSTKNKNEKINSKSAGDQSLEDSILEKISSN